jgi:hypothetical protein
MELLRRIKNRTALLLMIFLSFSLCMMLFPTSIAWDNCPFGEVNESYPGTCGRYTDSDQDGICDLSQSPPDARLQTSEENTNQQKNMTTTNSTTTRLNYYFIPILIVLSLCYAITYTFARKKRITLIQHRKIWNVLLLITFLVSGIFGLILAITISTGFRLSFYATLLFWHVEFGIAMATISIFHIAWHWNYYKKMVIKKNK